jgi:hypothetical protein
MALAAQSPLLLRDQCCKISFYGVRCWVLSSYAGLFFYCIASSLPHLYHLLVASIQVHPVTRQVGLLVVSALEAFLCHLLLNASASEWTGIYFLS